MLSLLFFVPGNPSMCNKYLLNTNTVPSASEFQKHKFMKDEAIGSSWSRFVLSGTCSPDQGRLHLLVMGEQTLTPAAPHLLLSIPSFFSLPLQPVQVPVHWFPQTLTSPLPCTWNALPTLQVYPNLPQRRLWEMVSLSLLRFSNAQLGWFQVYNSQVFVGKLLLHLNLFCIILTCSHFSGKSDHSSDTCLLQDLG